MDFFNSKVGQRWAVGAGGLGVASEHILGRMRPVRASTVLDYGIPPYPGEVEGGAVVLTEVQPWPFASDEEGCSFDQANLYGVRTVCRRRPLADGGGDNDYWTAVPRALPSGYTATGRCGSMVPGLYSDHLGDCFTSSPGWNLRTPTGLLLDTSTDDGLARSLWTPRNRNQKVINRSLSLSGTAVSNTGDVWRYIGYGYLETGHIGFRRIKLSVTFNNPGPILSGYPITVQKHMTIASVPMADPAWSIAEDPPPGKHDITSFTPSHTFTSIADPSHTDDLYFTDIIPPDDGKAVNFLVWCDPLTSSTDWEATGYMSFAAKMSPRTDVPLWYFASMGNRCAPGGYVPP